MKETLFAILTDPDARQASVIESKLSKEFIAGIPWS